MHCLTLLPTVVMLVASPLNLAPETLRALERQTSAAAPLRTIKGGVLDEIELYAETPPSPSTTRVVIRPFSATDADLGTGAAGGKERRQTEAKTMQTEAPKVLADRFAASLKESGPYADVSVLEGGAPAPPDTIVVDGKFTSLDPGSQAKRYFVGFGAGKSAVSVAGSVKTSDGTLLATFAHKRIGVMGTGGGDSLDKLTSDSRAIGGDIAKFLASWATKKSLKENPPDYALNSSLIRIVSGLGMSKKIAESVIAAEAMNRIRIAQVITNAGSRKLSSPNAEAAANTSKSTIKMNIVSAPNVAAWGLLNSVEPTTSPAITPATPSA